MERPGADSEEKREPVADIDIAVVDSLKVLDPRRPIRETDIAWAGQTRRDRPLGLLVRPRHPKDG
jgi:hypothetical protein